MTWRLVGAAWMLAAGTAAAQVQGPGLTLPPLGADHSIELTPSIGLRGWIGGRPGLLASDGVVASSMVMADWYPLAGGFRVSGGLAYGSTRPELPPWTGLASEGVARASTLPGVAPDPRSWLARGNPYLGVGWGLGAASVARGVYMTADLGVMYQRGNLANWGCPGGLATGPCGTDAHALDATALAYDSRFAPVMSLGVGLRF